MAVSGFGDLSRNLRELQRDLQPRRESLTALADRLVPEVKAAVVAELGDDSMSGWRRHAAIPIGGTAFVRKSSVMVVRDRTSAGMMRVLEQGRNQGNAGGMAGPGVSADGTTRRTKSGAVRKVANRSGLMVGDGRVRRKWNGRTKGKDTWSDALARMKRAAPGHVESIVGEELAARIVKVVTRG